MINCISNMKACGTEPNYRRRNRCMSDKYLPLIKADWEVVLPYPCITDEAIKAATINKSLSCMGTNLDSNGGLRQRVR